jgi:hypothetical protein
MGDYLSVVSDLEHDGDGVVSIRISARNVEFRATTVAWGNDTEPVELASTLKGFPRRLPDRAEYSFGTPGVGHCKLIFQTIDDVGHCCVWAEIEARYSSVGEDQFQRSTICVEFAPAALDRFCEQLQRFKRGRQNEARLGEHAL